MTSDELKELVGVAGLFGIRAVFSFKIGLFTVRIATGKEHQVNFDGPDQYEELSTPAICNKDPWEYDDFTVLVMGPRNVFKTGAVSVEDVFVSLPFKEKFDNCRARLNWDEAVLLCGSLQRKSKIIELLQ